MRRDSGAAAAVLLTGLLTGCGGQAPGLTIELQGQRLLSEAEVVAVYFYGPEVACQTVRQTVPRPPSILGPFQAPVGDEGRTRGIVFTLDRIPVGQYVVFVDALDVNGANVGAGCAPGQEIRDREVAKIRVVVSDQSP